jgi:hypothetical protein
LQVAEIGSMIERRDLVGKLDPGKENPGKENPGQAIIDHRSSCRPVTILRRHKP